MDDLPTLMRIIAPKLYRLILGLIIVGTIFNVISLESRASGIAMAIGLFILFMLSRNATLKLFLWAPVVLVALYFTPLPEGYEERIQSAFADKDNLDKSAASRPYFWSAATNMVEENPLGVGVNCFKAYFNVYEDGQEEFGKHRDVHSTHFQILSETGYLGLILWVWINVMSLLRNRTLRKLTYEVDCKLTNLIFYRQASTMLICSQLVFIISGSFYSLAYSDLIWIIFGITIVLTKLSNEEVKNSENNKNELLVK
jgi:O-antigen ligase